MDELIILEIEGRLTPEQRRELKRWREASHEHERRYREIRALWTLFEPEIRTDPVHEAPTAEELLEVTTSPPAGTPRTGPWLRKRGIAAAALLILVLGLASLANPWAESPAHRTAEFRAGPNELVTAVLDDGTVARLAPGTSLQATIGETHREIQLEGRAFFAVAHDGARPFRVTTAEGTARALGTRFEIDTRRNRLRLVVVEGRVALGSPGGDIELEAGEEARARTDAAPSVTFVEVPEALLDWMGAWVAFESTPLRRVARELEVRLGIEIEIADSGIAERTISGWFAEEDREQMLSMICRVADVRCDRSAEDRVRIEG